jgi:hypothetical protein
MNQPAFIRPLAFTSLTILSIAFIGCTRSITVPPHTTYNLKILHRSNLASQPCITGHLFHPTIKGIGVPYLLAISNNNTSYTNDAGDYKLFLQPGTTSVKFAAIGLLSIKFDNLRLRAGDSIRLDVHMRQDTSRLIHTTPY